MTLTSFILENIRRNHRGKERAIKRRELLEFARIYEPGLTDRELRQIYSELPVVSSEKGIFWPVSSEEIDEYHQYLRKKAIPLFERWRRVARAHKKLLSGKFYEQLELF